MTTRSPDPQDMSRLIKESWRRFLATYEPLRPELYRYCRHLTRTAWDAEDLVQDTLARAFTTLASMMEDVRSPRGWLFRIASNLWIDRTRRARDLVADLPLDEHVPDAEVSRAVRDAAGALLVRLSPQERAAVVLKDVFDMTLEEIAETLTTTPNAIKAALHRGRGKLVEPRVARPATPDPAVLDAFCIAFNARDLEKMTSLLLDTAVIELVGTYTEYGRNRRGLLHHTLFKPLSSGIDGKHLDGYLETPPRAEVRTLDGEPLVLYWYAHVGGESVRSIVRVSTEDERITSLREYFVTPDLIADVCSTLGVAFRTNGYP